MAEEFFDSTYRTSGKMASRLINSEVIHQKCITALQISSTVTLLKNSVELTITILLTCSRCRQILYDAILPDSASVATWIR